MKTDKQKKTIPTPLSRPGNTGETVHNTNEEDNGKQTSNNKKGAKTGKQTGTRRKKSRLTCFRAYPRTASAMMEAGCCGAVRVGKSTSRKGEPTLNDDRRARLRGGDVEGGEGGGVEGRNPTGSERERAKRKEAMNETRRSQRRERARGEGNGTKTMEQTPYVCACVCEPRGGWKEGEGRSTVPKTRGKG